MMMMWELNACVCLIVAIVHHNYLLRNIIFLHVALDNCTHGEVRLLFGSTEMEGTVEVCIHGFWGTICDNSWDSRDAGVICRQLGYSSFGINLSESLFRQIL